MYYQLDCRELRLPFDWQKMDLVSRQYSSMMHAWFVWYRLVFVYSEFWFCLQTSVFRRSNTMKINLNFNIMYVVIKIYVVIVSPLVQTQISLFCRTCLKYISKESSIFSSSTLGMPSMYNSIPTPAALP